MWVVGVCPFAIPDASWVAVAPRSGHTGWCVRHQVWGDILCMRVFMDVCTDNLIRATDTVIPTNPTPPLRLLKPLYIHVRPYILCWMLLTWVIGDYSSDAFSDVCWRCKDVKMM